MSTHSPAFLKGIDFVLPHENEYARGHWGDPNFVVTENVPGDGGGKTRYGIDQVSNPGVDIDHLTQTGATDIYWNNHNLDALPAALGVVSFDVWVNGGHAVLWLQHVINVVGRGASVSEDGSMGAMTIAAAKACNQPAVINLFLAQRDVRFKAIVASNPSQSKFLAGWLQRDIDLTNYLKGVTS